MKNYILGFIILLNVLLLATLNVSAGQVTNTLDSGAGSLREAVNQANATAADDAITFSIPASDANCLNNVCTITLTGGEIAVNSTATAGKLTINAASSASKISLSGNNANRIFYLKTGANLTLNTVALTNGDGIGATNPNRDNYGGAIYNFGGVLSLINSTAQTNYALYNGGVIYNDDGAVNISGSIFRNNKAHYNAGVIINSQAGTVTVTNSTISDNTVDLYGGGAVENDGTMTLTNSTVSGNSAESSGGGILNSFNATLTANDSTISGNTVNGAGGGLFNSHNATLINVTIAQNTANKNGGGIYQNPAGTPTTNLRNSIVAANVAVVGQPDIYHVNSVNDMFSSKGNNLIGNTSTNAPIVFLPTDVTGTNPHLTPLGFYGGNTNTQSLASDSAAINAGNNCVLTANGCLDNNPALPTDQRGAARIGTTDIGAFELNNALNGGTFVANLPDATNGQNYNFAVVPANSTNCTYQISSGSLPNNLTLVNSNGGYSITGTPTLSGTFRYAVTATCGTPAYTNVTSYAIQVRPSAPTAANITISGRVFNRNGRGLANATVVLTDSSGNILKARTNPFGWFSLSNVQSGDSYLIEVRCKGFRFEPQILSLFSDEDNVNFYPMQLSIKNTN